MNGFEDASNPVRLYLRGDSLLGTGPFEIDGAKATLTADGIRADVGNTRYFVPTHLIDHVEQDQTVSAPAQQPTTNPGQGGGQGGGRGEDNMAPRTRN